MEIKEQIKQNTPDPKKQEQQEALSEEELDNVAGGLRMMMGDETASSKNFCGQ